MSLELWPRKYKCGWDLLVSPDPLFGEHWSKAHLYSALALYSYCQWPGQHPDSWRWMRQKPSLITSLSPQGGCSTTLLRHLGPLCCLHIDLGISFSCIHIHHQTKPFQLLRSLGNLSHFPIWLCHYNHPLPCVRLLVINYIALICTTNLNNESAPK